MFYIEQKNMIQSFCGIALFQNDEKTLDVFHELIMGTSKNQEFHYYQI